MLQPRGNGLKEEVGVNVAKVSGGDKYKAFLANIANAAKPKKLRVGFLEGTVYPTGRPLPLVAATMEFGAPGAQFPIPPRPYFRTMIAKNKADWAPMASKLLIKNKYDIDKTFQTMGNVIAGQLRKSISETDSPALSQVTLMVRSMMIGRIQEAAGLTTVFEAVRRVKAGDRAKVRAKGKRGSKGSVSGKPLIFTGLLQSSVAFDIK